MILVTGGTGMVGAHLLFDLVSAGLSVRALTRTTAACEKTHTIFSCYSAEADTLFKKIEWVTGDVEDYHSLISALEGVELVYHTAAFVSFDPRHKKKIFSTNIYGTANVVNLSLIHI